jgi:magnesium-transporting ATPase (P-type)
VTAETLPQDMQWHGLDAPGVLARLASTAQGLSDSEAVQRQAELGLNSLPTPNPVNPLVRLLAQFNSALIYFLLAAAAAAFALGHRVDAGVILAVVVVNAIAGVLQEGRAERALAAISSLIAPQASVLRQGQRKSVRAETLVPGDIVLLEAGDRVPADARLIHARSLTVDEAMLTGESVTADKGEAAVPSDAPLAERSSMAYSGTLVATGQATAVVTAIGSSTEIGRISGLLGEVRELSTPLLRQMNRFAGRFSLAIFAVSAALFVFAVLIRDFAWADALIAVVALAVSAIPEGLPAVITITLAIGVQRMAGRKAVIRQLPAVETLGATSVICTDKTGTLTRNEMLVRHIFVPGHDLDVSGTGYAPQGVLTAANHDDDMAAIGAAAPIIRCSLLCNDAHLRSAGNAWVVEGDPMEGALVALAMKAGVDPAHERSEWVRLDEYPFDAAHRFMATLNRGPDGSYVVFIKGAPEAVHALCDASSIGEAWEAQIAQAAGMGERVLAFAQKRLAAPAEQFEIGLLAGGVEPLGLIGFIDPPRDEAVTAIAECRTAGIAVKMITGDHAATALTIARQIGIADNPAVISGTELDLLDDPALAVAVQRIDVFARASPEHKLRIVRALQAQGAIVAMTGDGVNDSPALKQANVGTAMGIKGTEAARQASDIVLLDDNFASIVAAVKEGRTVHDNIRKVIALTLPTNGGETAAVVLAILMGFTLPISATQILWINLVTETTLGLVLAFEPSEADIMKRPPRSPDAPLLSPFLLWRVLFVSVLFASAVLLVFYGALARGAEIELARTMAVNTLVAAEIFYLFNVRFLSAPSVTWRGALGTPAVLIAISVLVLAQFAFTYLPAMHALFESRPIGVLELLIVVGIGAVLMAIVELEKVVMRRLGWFQELRSPGSGPQRVQAERHAR